MRNSASDNPGRLVPQGEWKELNFIFKGAHVHCMCTACALHVHCMCTACALHVHRMRTACTLPALYLRAPYTLRMRLPLLPPPVCVLPGTWNPRAMELLPGTFKVVTSLPEASSMVLGATKISNPNP